MKVLYFVLTYALYYYCLLYTVSFCVFQLFGLKLHFGVRLSLQMVWSNGGAVEYTPPDGGWPWAVVIGAFIPLASLMHLADLFLYFTKKLKKYLMPAPVKCHGYPPS